MFEVPEHTKLRRLGLIKVSIGTDGHRPGTGRESSRTEPSSRDETPPASIHMLLMSLAHAIWTCVERSIVFPRGVSSLFLSYSGLGGVCFVFRTARVGLLVACTHQ